MEENLSVVVIDCEKLAEAQVEERAKQKAMVSVARVVCSIIGATVWIVITFKYGIGNGFLAALAMFGLVYYPIKFHVGYH